MQTSAKNKSVPLNVNFVSCLFIKQKVPIQMTFLCLLEIMEPKWNAGTFQGLIQSAQELLEELRMWPEILRLEIQETF